VVNLTGEHETLYYIHAVKEDDVVIRNCDGRVYHYQILNCMGELQAAGEINAGALTELKVPCAGMVIIQEDKRCYR
jgi:hypothetical protein